MYRHDIYGERGGQSGSDNILTGSISSFMQRRGILLYTDWHYTYGYDLCVGPSNDGIGHQRWRIGRRTDDTE